MVSPYLEQDTRGFLDAVLDRAIPGAEGKAVLFKVLDAMNLAVTITDRPVQGSRGPRFLYVNKAFCAMTGYSREDLVGRTPDLLQGPKTDLAAARAFSMRLYATGTASVCLVNYAADGSDYLTDILACRVSLGPPLDDEMYLAVSQRTQAAASAAFSVAPLTVQSMMV